MAEMKTAAYICSGCGIGERVSTAQMAKIAQKEGKMALVREHACLCDESGVQTIKDDIEKEAVTHIVLAACSRRVKTEAFNFPTVAMARANIREGVIWSQPEDAEHAETTQEMADDYVRMGCAEVKKMKVPEGNPNRASNKRILVVGGGVSGMTSALEMAEAGYDTVLVEKSGALGGWAAELVKRVPSQQPYADPADTGVAELAAKVAAHPRIAGFVVGTNDLAKDIGARYRPDREPLLTAISLCLLAGKAYGRIVVDGVYNAFKDDEGLRRECNQGRDMGFDGKTLIHPAQVAIANEVFAPSEEEIDLARRHTAAYEEAEREGRGVAVVDGRIVEKLHVVAAQRILARAAAIARVREGAPS